MPIERRSYVATPLTSTESDQFRTTPQIERAAPTNRDTLSASNSRRNVLSAAELELLNDFFSRRFGLYFRPDQKEYLAWRLWPRLEALGLRSFLEYYRWLKSEESELASVVGLITNRESYFFRERSQLICLERTAADLPSLRLCSQPRFLSAGCACGEEPYSLYILSQRVDSRLRGARIDAIDLNPECIRAAEQGLYEEKALRHLGAWHVQRFFDRREAGSFELRQEHRTRVQFHCANILELDQYSEEARYDAVLCRNVMIYFSAATREKALSQLARVLRPGGLLLLGHSESIIGKSSAFRGELIGERILYRRLVS